MATAKKAAKKTAKKTAKKAAKKTAAGFTDEERAAMKDRAAELKAERADRSRADGEKDVLAKIAKMSEPDRGMAQRIHEIVTSAAPDLVPRTWYGMPAYSQDGDVLVYFQDAAKFKARYATLGFSDKAKLDQGSMWPASYALTQLTASAEKEIRALVRKAVG